MLLESQRVTRKKTKLTDPTKIFPDQSHINKVRDALSIRPTSRASVMIGSGFSRNAKKIHFNTPDMPMWTDIAKCLFQRLYPEHSDDNSASVSNVLRLAQEYETAHGQSDLYEFLNQLIRDTEFIPGEAHFQLLKLPWRDVFTTNWDTLLERASSSILERPYRLVQSVKQLPIAAQPRIIKLHGSFPSQFPLIVAEENYRTYPTKFAPFVNTVQQAMMETVFFLIGFSGDDPNFLNWSGWVRDNLGESALTIYLAGYLNLSTHRRRMLEAHGVVPIDLAKHPNATTWPDSRRDEYATQWLLHTLRPSRPYDEARWPSAPIDKEKPIPEQLLPLMRITTEVPIKEPNKTQQDGQQDKDHDLRRQVMEVIEYWTHNRQLYPQWLVFPPGHERSELSRRTDEWEPSILDVLPSLSPLEQLTALRELVWRKEILLEPATPELEAIARSTLNKIDCQRYTVEGVHEAPDDWEEVRKAWVDVALTLLTNARLDCNLNAFQSHLNALRPFGHEDANVAHRLCHERCLWAIYSLAFARLNALLDEWMVEESTPDWMLRKAALLTEAGRHDESVSLIQLALSLLRQGPTGGRTIASASREAWALASTLTANNRLSVSREWEKLASMKCDPPAEMDHLRRMLSHADEKDESPSFDLGARNASRLRFSNLGRSRLIAAYRTIRLPEVSGVPPVNNPGETSDMPVSIMSDLFPQAADQLVMTNPKLAIRLVLRTCNYDEDNTLQRVLSRIHLAVLDVHSAEELAHICIAAIDYAYPRLTTSGESSGGISWIERLRVTLEVLSRLVLRLPPVTVHETLEIALKLYSTDRIVQHTWMGPPLENLLKRTWEALSSDERSSRAFDLLTAPIAELDGFTAARNCPDPGRLVKAMDLPTNRTPHNDKQYSEVVDYLVRGLLSTGDGRARVVARLIPLTLSHNLTIKESSKVANALWLNSDPILSNASGPRAPFDWVYLILPEIDEGQAERSFRSKWLTVTSDHHDESPAHSTDMLTQVGAALSGMRGQGREFKLSSDDESQIAVHIEKIVEMFSSNSISFDLGIGSTILHLSSLAIEITLPEHIVDSLYRQIEDTLEMPDHGNDPMMRPINDIRISLAFALVPGLIKAMPDRFEALSLWLRTGLASESELRVGAAMAALRSWLSASEKSTLPPVPDDLIREVGAIIASGRRVALIDALICATLVFDRGSESHRDTIKTLVLQGLSYLAEKLKYDSEHDSHGDVHTLRLLCTQLATHIAGQGYANDATIAKWIDMGKSDPFPETRNLIQSFSLD